MSQTQCSSAEYIGADARLLIVPLSSSPVMVGGLNTYKLPGKTREKVTIDDFTKDFAGGRAGSGTMADLTFGGNYLSGNPAQNTFEKRLEENTEFTDIRLYLNWKGETDINNVTLDNRGDFWALDLARDPCSKMQMSSFDFQDVAKSAVCAFSGGCFVDGKEAVFNVHSNDVLEYDVVSGVLTALDGDLVNDGFKKDMSVILDTGSATKKYIYAKIASVTATTLTFTDTSIALASGEGQIHGSTKTAAEV